jgi:serine phosphatase RsbU (regulator of sigma subunit)
LIRPPNRVDASLIVRHALVVDDDSDISLLLRTRLGAHGFVTHAASNGDEALVRLADSRIDLVLLDVSMPGIDGFEVLEHIRAAGLDVAVIMTTAFGSERVVVDALRLGADDYLRKPFEASELSAVVDRAMARLKLKRQNAALRSQLDEERRQLAAERSRAGQVQAMLLPGQSYSGRSYDVAACCLPARDVGGDFYDWQDLSATALALSVGDVMGKGMPAAILAATVRAALRASVAQPSPLGTVNAISRALASEFERSGSFLTLFFARFDEVSRRLAFVDAGHGYAFVRRVEGRIETLGPRGLPLGVDPSAEYDEGEIEIADGDALVVFSDGIIDSLGIGDGDRKRLADIVGTETPPSEVVRRFIEIAEAEPSVDDFTVLVLRSRSTRI